MPEKVKRARSSCLLKLVLSLGVLSVDILRTGAAVVFVEVFYLGVVEGRRVAHDLVKARRRRRGGVVSGVELPVNHRRVTCTEKH